MKLWHMLDLAYALVSGDHERLLGGSEHYYVARVEVWGEPPAGANPYHIHDLVDQTTLLARRAPHLGNPVVLRLSFSEFHKRWVGPKKTVGENVMLVTGSVFSLNGQTELGRTAITLCEDSYVDRAINTTVSFVSTEVEAQRTMDVEAASALLERVYGTEDWDTWMHNPY